MRSRGVVVVLAVVAVILAMSASMVCVRVRGAMECCIVKCVLVHHRTSKTKIVVRAHMSD